MIWFTEVSKFLIVAESLDQVIESVEKQMTNYPEVEGYCDICRSVNTFKNNIDLNNWVDNRSQFQCDNCKFPARFRMFWKSMDEVIATLPPDAAILSLEAVTPFARELRKRRPSTIFSEYFEGQPQGAAQRHDDFNFINEDLLNLSFAENTLDLVLHQDVLEHVPDADRALREIYRVLRPAGNTLFTAPFYHACNASVKRAAIVNGELKYFTPPIYHGNPLSPAGSLVFEVFGVDFFKRCIDCGYSTCAIGLDYDVARCFLSNGNPYPVGKMLPVLFCLTK